MDTKKITVEYKGGESRYYPGESVDYMIANVDEVELYAEARPGDSETDTYDALRLVIVEQARANHIDPRRLRFQYDKEGGQSDH